MTKVLAIFLGLFLLAQVHSLQAQDYDGSEQKGNVNVAAGFALPLAPTSRYAGVSGNFAIGGGYDFNRYHAIVAEFMWSGLPPTHSALRAITPLIVNPGTDVKKSSNLYSLTANYMFRLEGNRVGGYVIGGGGWYYRRSKLTNQVVQPYTACSDFWLWWGYACTSGYVTVDDTIATSGSSAFGGNAGLGFTLKVAESGEKFYIESRYHYAPTKGIATTLVLISFGFRY